SKAKLWILDEPLTAIDKSGVAKLIALFEQHTRLGGIILLTTHQDLDYRMRKLRLSGEETAL
ncbi:MAG: heme ABC transporter ATP-binding protein CcmA, partial [Enterobacterales bacterium]|nr:heme ABC transporter ATP-binding protein CcmA [Enterobacterales bacterium]